MQIPSSQYTIFREIAIQKGITEEQIKILVAHAELVCKHGETTNLISRSNSQRILTRHTLDSLYLAVQAKLFIDKTLPAKILDMGAGAGFPAVPLAITLPHCQIFAAEPRQKRVEFLRIVCNELNLKNFTILPQRTEMCSLPPMDMVCCRALGSLEDDWKRAKQHLKKTGTFYTFKVHEEKAPARTQMQMHKYNLPGEEHSFILTQLEFND